MHVAKLKDYRHNNKSKHAKIYFNIDSLVLCITFWQSIKEQKISFRNAKTPHKLGKAGLVKKKDNFIPSPPLKEAVLQNNNDYDESFIIYKKNFISL